MRKKRLGFIFIVLLLGGLVGTALGEVLGLVLPEGVVKEFFLRSASFGFSPTEISLVIIQFTIGFWLKINIIGVIGIILIGYLLRWLD